MKASSRIKKIVKKRYLRAGVSQMTAGGNRKNPSLISASRSGERKTTKS